MQILKEYKTYIIVFVLAVILCLSFYFLVNPIKSKWSDFILSTKEVRHLKEENIEFKKVKDQWIDSANYYKNLAAKYEKSADSSKIITVYIKQKTNEEVNNIITLSLDSNVKQFPYDMEEYLSHRVNK